MGIIEDPFLAIATEQTESEFSTLTRKPASNISSQPVHGAATATARFSGFDLEDQPLVADLARLPGQVVSARTVVALRREMIGSSCVIVFEDGDPQRPIILGVIADPRRQNTSLIPPQKSMSVQADDERIEITAEREIVLKCGDASITLTRAGKVIIKGNYILSRATGYNKIKGAAIDIN